MGTKGTCVLVLDDDLTCRNIVDEMLRHCNYEVLNIEGSLDLLNSLWKAKDRIELVLTNAHLLGSKGVEIVRYIQNKFNLPILLMYPDRTEIESKEKRCNFAAYILNGLSKNAVKNLWQFAFEKEKIKKVSVNNQREDCHKGMVNNDAVVKDKTPSSSISEAKGSIQNLKRKLSDKDEGEREDSPNQKKQRVVWTAEMHQKFLEAIEILGYEKAVPKKIVEVMNVPGITRENVASHLQKFRGGLKRNQETVLLSALSGRSGTNASKISSLLPSHSTPQLSSFSRNYYSIFQQAPLNPNIEKSASFSTHYHLNAQNLGTSIYGITEKTQQKYVPSLQLNRDFRIQSDQTKNMLLIASNSSDGFNQSTGYDFIGYRLTSNGNSIEFGKRECSFTNRTNGDTLVSAGASGYQFTGFIQQNPTLNQNPPILTGCIYPQPSIFGNLPDEISFQSPSVSGFQENQDQAQYITFGNPVLIPGNESTDKFFEFSQPCLQSMETPSNEAAFHPSEDEISMSIPSASDHGISVEDESSMLFLSDQDFSLSDLEIPMYDLPDNDSSLLFNDDDPQQLTHHSPSQLHQILQELSDCLHNDGIDDAVMSGNGSSEPQFEWEEFDDGLFGY